MTRMTQIAVVLAAAAVIASQAMPALAGPSARSAAGATATAQKALKAAKAAETRSKTAEADAAKALANSKTGPSGAPGANGGDGANGGNGTAGTNGAAGSGRAFGYVDAAGTTVTRGKGVVAVTHPTANSYCIKLAPSINASQTGLTATPDFSFDSTGATNTNNNDQAAAEWRSSNSDWSGVTNAVDVVTYEQTFAGGAFIGNAPVGEPFFFTVP